MNKNTKCLIGKTIKSINSKSINMWVMKFTDGSSIQLWAEIDGPLSLAQIWLDKFKEK